MTEIVEGRDELHGHLLSHKSDIDKRISRLMVASAGRVVKNEAKAIAMSKLQKRSGSLFKNIAIKRETKNVPAGTTQYNLGVRHGRDLGRKAQSELAIGKNGRVIRRYIDDPYYWFMHEFGTRHMPKRDFIAPALENKRGEAIKAMEERLAAELRKRSE